jgi:mycoredoxin
MAQVQVYGADWCEDTQRSRQHLERLGVPYDYINVEHGPQASAWVKSQNNGKEKKPTIKIGTTILSEPSDPELEQALRTQGVLR